MAVLIRGMKGTGRAFGFAFTAGVGASDLVVQYLLPQLRHQVCMSQTRAAGLVTLWAVCWVSCCSGQPTAVPQHMGQLGGG